MPITWYMVERIGAYYLVLAKRAAFRWGRLESKGKGIIRAWLQPTEVAGLHSCRVSGSIQSKHMILCVYLHSLI